MALRDHTNDVSIRTSGALRATNVGDGLETQLQKGVSNLVEGVAEAEEAFGKIGVCINKMKEETSFRSGLYWRPSQHSTLKDSKEKWTAYRQKFRSIVTKSKVFAGTAKGTLDDYIDIQLPMLGDVNIPVSEKGSNLKRLLEHLEERRQSAQDVSEEIHVLHVNVNVILEAVSALPVMKSNRLSQAVAATLAYERLPTDIGTLLEVLMNTEGGALLKKLGAICNVWAAIASALLEIHERLDMIHPAAGRQGFDQASSRRVELLNVQLHTLRDALHKYQTTIVLSV